MILFIAPNPHKTKMHEGYLQRVFAIDELFPNETKVYFDDIRSNHSELAKTLVGADMVYVHSIYQAEKILSSYPLLADKLVTDLHGVVPEEVAYMGDLEGSKRLDKVEREVFRSGKRFVAVSDAMVTHFSKKYKLPNDIEWIVLPIFTTKHPTKTQNNKKPIVVYAGGAQGWQNVDLMVEAINNTYQNYAFKILTHDPASFSGITTLAKKKVEITSALPSKVANYYKSASLGFMLRDDISINKVACPTKLIEYLEYGMVPIVLSPKIGDFQKLGYSYIELNDFVNKHIDADVLDKAAANNYSVLNKLHLKSNDGSTKLTNLYKKMLKIPKPTKSVAKMQSKLIENSCRIDELQSSVTKLQNQIEHQNQLLKNYEERAQYYQKTLEDILQSRRWRAMKIVLSPLSLKKYIKK